MEKTYLEELYANIKALVDRSTNDMYALLLDVFSNGTDAILPKHQETAEAFLNTIQKDPTLAPSAPVYHTRHAKLTNVQRQQYIDSGGGNCPICGSWEIEGDNFEFEGGTVFQSVSCLSCEATWDDVYQLNNIINISVHERVS